jgi:hypothetical protein
VREKAMEAEGKGTNKKGEKVDKYFISLLCSAAGLENRLEGLRKL